MASIGATPIENKKLEHDLSDLFQKYNESYGSRRLVKELRKKNYDVGRYKVRKLMAKLGLVTRYPKA